MTKKAKCIKPMDLSQMSLGAAQAWRRLLPLGLASSLPQMLHGENHVDYRYEYYNEDNNRITVNTHSVYFEQAMVDSIIAKGEFTYDGISGATPTGGYDNGKVLLFHMEDVRRAESLQFDCRLGNNTLTPGFAYSKESDYESYAVSLNDALEFNEKNTTLSFGISHNFDSVRTADYVNWDNKQSTEGMIGVSQLLSPTTILTANFTYGNDSGYLNDPYRVVDYSLSGFAYPEVRPSHRNKQVVYTSVTHYFDKFNASIEGSYRFYHDSYEVYANTAALTWHQKLGSHLIMEPLFRFYEQSAASFYRLEVNNSSPGAPFGENPTFYSADYRLSELYTLDCGAQLTGVINDHLRVVAGYHRYEMHGLDGTTPSAAYPKANVFTVGLSILW
jgi:hypothetical protein